MNFKTLALLPLFSVALVFSGCGGGSAQIGPKEANLFGVVKVEEKAYTPSSPNTFAVSSGELYTRKNFGGNKFTFLWGLVTLKDY